MSSEIKGDSNDDIPSPDLLHPDSQLYQFVTNPNTKPDSDGVYSINYTDPNYIEGDYQTILLSYYQTILLSVERSV